MGKARVFAREATGTRAGEHSNALGRDTMRALVVACGLLLGLLAGCQRPAKVTQQEEVIARQTTEQMSASASAIAGSRYRSYRWMTGEEMVRYRLGYDPTMSAGTRDAIEQAVDDDLADKGFQRSEPADFVVAFSDVYIDRNRSAPGWAFEGPAIEATGGVGGSQVEAYVPDPGGSVLDPVSRRADPPLAVARHGTRAPARRKRPAERRGDRNDRVPRAR